MQVECVDLKVTPYVCLYKYNNLRTAEWIFNKLYINFKIVHPHYVNSPVYIQYIFLSVQSTQYKSIRQHILAYNKPKYVA